MTKKHKINMKVNKPLFLTIMLVIREALDVFLAVNKEKTPSEIIVFRG